LITRLAIGQKVAAAIALNVDAKPVLSHSTARGTAPVAGPRISAPARNPRRAIAA
jgi:hypothetical protein